MYRLIRFGYTHSLWVLLAATLVTIGALVCLPALRVDVGSEGLTRADSPLRLAHSKVRAEFGSDLVAVIYAEHPDLFTAERLKGLQEVDRAARALPFVERVESLFTLPDIRDVGGILETAPLLQTIPTDPADLAAKKAQAMDNRLLLKNVLSADGTATVLTLYLKPDRVATLSMRAVQSEIDALLRPHQAEFLELFQLGKPALQSWLMRSLQTDQQFILPAAALLLLVLLAANQRSLVAGILPIANGVIATVWTLGVMSLTGIPVSLLNYIIPALIIVVGSTEDMHILHEFRTHLRQKVDGQRAIEEAARGIGLALVLTASTTILGFAATATSSLPILQTFGLAAMIGMTVRFFISILVLPAALRALHRWLQGRADNALFSPRCARQAAHFIVRRFVPRLFPVVGVLALVLLGAIYAMREIRISNDLISFVDKDTTLYRQLERSAERLAGSKILFLTLYDQSGAFRQPANLEELDAITEYLRGIPEMDTAISFADIIRRINEQLRGGDPADDVIPGTSAAIQQMLLFARMDDFSAYVSPDFARANIVIRCNINDSTLLNERAKEIRAALASGRFGPHVYTLTGEALVVASAVDSIVTAQVVSLGGMTILLFAIVAGLFLSVKCGLLTVSANLFPIALVFGLMGLTGISLNVGTCMIAAITLGIAIDDTLHLLVRFNRELKTTRREKTAIENALRHELNPVVSTSIALAGGFVVLAFSSFGPVREFGLLSASVLILALATDMVVTPMLFARTRLVTLWDLVGLRMRERLLRESPFFKGFTVWQAKKIILASHIEEFEAGARIIRFQDLGNKMYVVLSGELEASVGEGDDRRVLTRIGVGGVLGEVALVAKVRRSADVTAMSEARLLSLDASSLERLQRFSPFLASRLFLNIASIIGERLADRIAETMPSPMGGRAKGAESTPSPGTA